MLPNHTSDSSGKAGLWLGTADKMTPGDMFVTLTVPEAGSPKQPLGWAQTLKNTYGGATQSVPSWLYSCDPPGLAFPVCAVLKPWLPHAMPVFFFFFYPERKGGRKKRWQEREKAGGRDGGTVSVFHVVCHHANFPIEKWAINKMNKLEIRLVRVPAARYQPLPQEYRCFFRISSLNASFCLLSSLQSVSHSSR